MEEKLLKIVEGDPGKIIQQLKEEGVKVLHRFGDTLVIKDEPVRDFSTNVSKKIRPIEVKPLLDSPVEIREENIALLAFRLRQTENFQQSKEDRATEGQEWGEIFKNI